MNYTKGEWAYTPHPKEGGFVHSLEKGIAFYVGHENGNLIAAAPEMYEALKAITSQFAAAVEHPYSSDKKVYTQALKALAKAEGK